MSTYRDELYKATEANIADIKNQITILTDKLSDLEKMKTTYMFAGDDRHIEIIDNKIKNKHLKSKKSLCKNDNEYILSNLMKHYRELVDIEKRNGSGEVVLDMKAIITYNSLCKKEINNNVSDDKTPYPQDISNVEYQYHVLSEN